MEPGILWRVNEDGKINKSGVAALLLKDIIGPLQTDCTHIIIMLFNSSPFMDLLTKVHHSFPALQSHLSPTRSIQLNSLGK